MDTYGYSKYVKMLGNLCFIFSLIAVFVGPFCYRKFWSKGCWDHTEKEGNESIGSISPQVQIKISYPHEMYALPNDTFSDTSVSAHDSNDFIEGKEMKQTVQNTKPVSLESQHIVPDMQLLNSRSLSRKIWSSPLRTKLDNINNASSDMHEGSMKIVQAQVESRPASSASGNCETLDSTMYKSIHALPKKKSYSYLSDKKERSPSSKVEKMLKFLKTFWRRRKSVSFKEFESDETQRFKISPSSVQHASAAQSMVLHRNRFVDASTSTRISTNVLQTKPHNNGEQNNSNEDNESSKVLCSRTQALQEVMSLLSHRSSNGSLKCDISLSNLCLSKSDLSRLLKVTDSGAQSASLLTTEEASVFSIKLHRRNNNSKSVRDTGRSKNESLYRGLPNRTFNVSNKSVRKEHATLKAKIA